MKPIRSRTHLLLGLFLALLLLAAFGCSQDNEVAATAEPQAEELDIPAEVADAQEAALAFVRQGAIICVPPEGAGWRTDLGRAPAGYEVYRFQSGGCLMTVAYAPEEPEPFFHIGLHNDEIDYCWQGLVDRSGKVTATGTSAEMAPDLVEAAAAHCRDRGYEYKVQEQPDGSQCGVCLFPDESSCKAWLFYQDACGPEENADPES